MRKLNRAQFANRVTQLLGGKNRPTLTAAALVLLMAVGAAGALLASHVSRMREEVLHSRLLEGLPLQGEQSGVAQIFSDPKRYALLLDYLDAMADELADLEVTPQWGLAQFSVLLDAAQQADVEILGFDGPENGFLEVDCRGDQAACAAFLEKLDTSGLFDRAQLGHEDEQTSQQFTINCYFKQ